MEAASRSEVDWMIRRHYLGKWPGVCVLILALQVDASPRGVVVFALPPRETAKRYGCMTWELARLWVADEIPRNAETWLISAAVRHVRRTARVGMLVSYADPSVGHSGTIYRAANWVYDGMTDDDRKSPRCDYVDGATGKRYSRRSHVPVAAVVRRVPRTRKHRFTYRIP